MKVKSWRRIVIGERPPARPRCEARENFARLESAREDGGPPLDRTVIADGSNRGNTNTQVTTGPPVLFAGGGFTHGQHLAFDTQHYHALPNSFVLILRRMGIPADQFATSRGARRGLAMA